MIIIVHYVMKKNPFILQETSSTGQLGPECKSNTTDIFDRDWIECSIMENCVKY